MNEITLLIMIIVSFFSGMFCEWWMGKQGMIFNKREWKKARAEIDEWIKKERKDYRRRFQSWHDDLVYREKQVKRFEKAIQIAEESSQFEEDGTPITP